MWIETCRNTDCDTLILPRKDEVECCEFLRNCSKFFRLHGVICRNTNIYSYSVVFPLQPVALLHLFNSVCLLSQIARQHQLRGLKTTIATQFADAQLSATARPTTAVSKQWLSSPRLGHFRVAEPLQ